MIKRYGVWIVIILVLIGLYFSNFYLKQNDFMTFYDSGIAVKLSKNIYSFEENRTGMPTMLPPFASILFFPFALLPYKLSALIYNLLKLLCIGFIVKYLISKLSIDIKKEKLLLFIIFLLTFKYYLNDFKLGQINSFQVFFIVLFFKFLIDKRYLLSSIFLVLSFSLKPTPIYLGILIFLISKITDKIKFVLYTCLIIICLHVIIPIFIYGYKKAYNYSISYYNMAIGPNKYAPTYTGNYSIQALFYRYFTNTNVIVNHKTNEKIKINIADINPNIIFIFSLLFCITLTFILIYYQINSPKYHSLINLYLFSFGVLTMTIITPLIKSAHEVFLIIPYFTLLYFYFYNRKREYIYYTLILIILTLVTSKSIIGRNFCELSSIFGLTTIKYVILYIMNIKMLRSYIRK